MTVNVTITDPLEIRHIGLKALNKALGAEGTKVFFDQYFKGRGDYTKEKYELPEPSFEELTNELKKFCEKKKND